MRVVKILVVPAVLFLLFALPVSADFGGAVDNETSYTKKAEDDFLFENKFSFWFNSYLGDHYKFDMGVSAFVTTESPSFYADVDRLTLSGTFPASEANSFLFGFEMGRFFQSEFTSVVLAHSIDGLRFTFSYPSTNLKIAFGYTGLINKNYATIMLSRLDSVDDADDDVYFASPRFIGALSWDFPELFLRQTLSLAFIAQEDMRHVFKDVVEEGTEIQDPTNGGRVNTQYVGIGLSGPLVPSLYYDLYFYFGTGKMLTWGEDSQSSTGSSYQYEMILSYLVGGSVRYYLPELLQSAAAVKFLYASGDSDSVSFLEGNTKGDSTAFVPLADGLYGIAFVPKASNIMLAEFSYSIKPFSVMKDSALNSIQLVGKVTPFFKPVKGVISEAEVDPTSSSGYLGTEIDGVVNFRPFSDLGLSLSLGVFLPNSSMFVPDADSTWLVGKLLFSFSY